jgi:hypothetical protein
MCQRIPKLKNIPKASQNGIKKYSRLFYVGSQHKKYLTHNSVVPKKIDSKHRLQQPIPSTVAQAVTLLIYSEGVLFESWPGHRPIRSQVFLGFSIPP